MDIFEYMQQNRGGQKKDSPLASRLRPTTLDEVVGQDAYPADLLHQGRDVGPSAHIALRASARSANSPPAIIWTTRLPIAVPSTGPATTSSPVASAVRELRYLS